LIERKADINLANSENLSAANIAHRLAVFPREMLLIKHAVLPETRLSPVDENIREDREYVAALPIQSNPIQSNPTQSNPTQPNPI
jgi:hypothetical protein